MLKIVALAILVFCNWKVKSFHHHSLRLEKYQRSLRSLEIPSNSIAYDKVDASWRDNGLGEKKNLILAMRNQGSMFQEKNPLKSTIYFFDDLLNNCDMSKYFPEKVENDLSKNVLGDVAYYIDDLLQNQNLDKYFVHNEENALSKALRNLVWSVDDMQFNFANLFKELSIPIPISVDPAHAMPRPISLYGLSDPATKQGAHSRRTWALAAVQDQTLNSTENLDVSVQIEKNQDGAQKVLADPKPPHGLNTKIFEDVHVTAPTQNSVAEEISNVLNVDVSEPKLSVTSVPEALITQVAESEKVALNPLPNHGRPLQRRRTFYRHRPFTQASSFSCFYDPVPPFPSLTTAEASTTPEKPTTAPQYLAPMQKAEKNSEDFLKNHGRFTFKKRPAFFTTRTHANQEEKKRSATFLRHVIPQRPTFFTNRAYCQKQLEENSRTLIKNHGRFSPQRPSFFRTRTYSQHKEGNNSEAVLKSHGRFIPKRPVFFKIRTHSQNTAKSPKGSMTSFGRLNPLRPVFQTKRTYHLQKPATASKPLKTSPGRFFLQRPVFYETRKFVQKLATASQPLKMSPGRFFLQRPVFYETRKFVQPPKQTTAELFQRLVPLISTQYAKMAAIQKTKKLDSPQILEGDLIETCQLLNEDDSESNDVSRFSRNLSAVVKQISTRDPTLKAAAQEKIRKVCNDLSTIQPVPQNFDENSLDGRWKAIYHEDEQLASVPMISKFLTLQSMQQKILPGNAAIEEELTYKLRGLPFRFPVMKEALYRSKGQKLASHTSYGLYSSGVFETQEMIYLSDDLRIMKDCAANTFTVYQRHR